MIDEKTLDTDVKLERSKNIKQCQLTLFDMCQENDKYVREIPYEETKQFILEIHYARRMPSISYAFGLFVNKELVGCITYGVPASPSLCIGLAGRKNQYNILELNRLVLLPKYNGKNYASFLVAHSLKLLPNRTFVVSYADTMWGHVGYIYQATNFLYTGFSAQRTDTYQPTGKHSRHQETNDLMVRQTRSAKHRYVYLVGDKRTKREMRSELLYPIKPYPKGNDSKYDIDNPQPIKPVMVYVKKNVHTTE